MVKQLTLAVPLLAADPSGTPGVNSEAKWSETIDLMSKYGDLANPGKPDQYWDSTYAGKA